MTITKNWFQLTFLFPKIKGSKLSNILTGNFTSRITVTFLKTHTHTYIHMLL